MRNHFSLSGWRDRYSFTLIRADADWMSGSEFSTLPAVYTERFSANGYFSITVGLLGFCACLTFWPAGKYA